MKRTLLFVRGIMRAEQVEAVRVALVGAVRTVLLGCGQTQKQIAAATGLDQPRISRLLRGTTNALAAERALATFNDLGYDVHIVVQRRPAAAKAEGQTSVEVRG